MTTSVMQFQSALSAARSPDEDATTEDIERFLTLLGKEEAHIIKWGAVMEQLIAHRLAFCAQILEYNAAALNFLRVQMKLVFQLERAGARNVPRPFFPTLFGREVRVEKLGDKGLRFAVSVPGCGPTGSGRPNYDLFKIVKPGGAAADIALELPENGVVEAGVFDASSELGFPWVPLIIGAILVGGAAAVAIKLGVFEQAEVEIARINAGNAVTRTINYHTCTQSDIATLQRNGARITEEVLDKIRGRCARNAGLLVPDAQLPPRDDGMLMTIAKVGAVIGGGVIGYKYARKKGWV